MTSQQAQRTQEFFLTKVLHQHLTLRLLRQQIGGQDILNLEHEDVIDDVVFAVVRTTDKDEAQEIYLIVNND